MAKNNSKTPNTNDKMQDGPRPMPLFYNNPVPLDKNLHSELAIKKDITLQFTKKVNAVPVNLIEMPQLLHYYPIAFSPDSSATPVAILGLRDQENLFVDENGKWQSDTYVPAYIRRYPFIFSEIPGTNQLTLCIDNSDHVVEENGEQKLFDGGEPSQLSKNALEFCKSYHAAALQTLEFSKALEESGILVTKEAQVNIANSSKINFSGFRVVDEKKLAELPDETIIEWKNKGWLSFIYAHIFSNNQWQRLTRLLGETIQKEAA